MISSHNLTRSSPFVNTLRGKNRDTTALNPPRQVYVDQLAEQLSYRQVLKKACESIELATSDANAKVTSKVQ